MNTYAASFKNYLDIPDAIRVLSNNAAGLTEIRFINNVYLMVYTANYQLFF